MSAAAGHRAPLGTTRWELWREAAVRGAGFPAEQVLVICDDELAEAADGVDDGIPATVDTYHTAYAAATERLAGAIRATAAEDRFREAVTWQNPRLLPTCLDRVVAGGPRSKKHGRGHELTIANYLQRYCLKNDTVGFFGPVGWARMVPDGDSLSVSPGPDLLSRRTTYFEAWAIDAVAAAVAARPEVWPWLTPRVAPSAVLTGRVLRLPSRKPDLLSAYEVRLLERCDGRRTVRDIAGDPLDPDALDALMRLRDLGAVRVDLQSPLGPWPERDLQQRIATIGDAAVRDRALAPVTELVAARGEVSAAAGDPDRLARAINALSQAFERITGEGASRRPGATYAGRTLVYEDAMRCVEVGVGRQVMDALSAPLGLILDSGRWLANTVAERYLAICLRMFDREVASSGGHTVPLMRLLTTAMPEALYTSGYPESEIVDDVVAEFRRRWGRALDLPPGGRRHRTTADAIAGRVAREFATGPPLWSGARRHSPDVMIAADGPGAVARGEYDFVLGELHLATNTLEARLFVEQHPEPERMRDAAAADSLNHRVCAIPRWESPLAISRLARPTRLMLPSYTYLTVGAETMTPPPSATLLPVADLYAERRGDHLVVRRGAGGQEYDLLEVIGDLLTALVANAFRPFAAAAHQPRVSVDRLVMSRESWTLDAAGTEWAFLTSERQRFLRARRWRSEHGMPQRCFVRVPVEGKPMAVDFRSLPLVNLLAKSIRKTAHAGRVNVTISEMLPDIDRLWLCDAAGERYTSELRFVGVDTTERPAPTAPVAAGREAARPVG